MKKPRLKHSFYPGKVNAAQLMHGPKFKPNCLKNGPM